MHLKLHFLLLLLGLAGSMSGQRVLSPSEYLPHNLGEQFSRHHLLTDYYQYVSTTSDRVQLIEYGRTNEQRPLQMAFVSTPENLDQLEAIRLDHLRKIGVEEGAPSLEKDYAIVWLSFGVHGNEAGATESSMQVLFELVSDQREEVADWLENTIVILDPSINPDGYDRYTGWYRSVSNNDPDPDRIGREHMEPWPGGRVNHYYFDLNRDWAWATQVETQQRLVEYNRWLPHIHGDYHEQFPDDNYYFAPAAEPYHFFITDWQREFQVELGLGNAKNFDQNGWLYYTREIFDLLYPSYGDTYPIFNGAIGMTFEMAGHGISGRAIEKENGDLLTLDQRIEQHNSTALNNIELASQNAEGLVDNMVTFYENARKSPPGKYKSFVIPLDNDFDKLQSLVSLLDRHGIQYGKAGKKRQIKAFSYQSGATENVEVQAEDLVISAYQSKGVLAQVLFEPEVELYDSLTYDITAWSIPYAHGLNAFASEDRLEPGTNNYLFISEVPDVMEEPYAYLFRWGSTKDAEMLGAFLQAGIQVRYAEAAFTINGVQYDPGTLVITQNDNRSVENLMGYVKEFSEKYGQYFIPIQTGYVEAGRDLGSSGFKFIKKPEVLIFHGDRLNGNAFGQTWYYFEQVMDYPATIVDIDHFSRINLHEYNVVVMPSGSYSLGSDDLDNLQDWMRSGGRVIAMGGALRTFSNQDGFSLQSKDRPSSEEEDEPAVYAERTRKFLDGFTPGAIISCKVDSTHPLGFGMDGQYFTLKTSSRLYNYLDSGWTAGYINDEHRISGFVGQNLKKQLGKSLVFGMEQKGRGGIIYMADNPLFRGFWEQGNFLFANALFLAGQ